MVYAIAPPDLGYGAHDPGVLIATALKIGVLHHLVFFGFCFCFRRM